MPTSTFQEQGTVTLVPVASLPQESNVVARVAQAARVCWTVGHVGVTSSSPLSRASSARAPRSFSTIGCKKRHGTAVTGLLLLRQVPEAKRSKDSLSPSATRNTESIVASSSTCRRRPLQQGFLSAGKLHVDRYFVTGIAIDEKQLISWARTNRPKNWRRPYMSVSKLKQQVEAASRKKRKWCTICCSRQKSRCVDRVASHISTCTWIAAQKPGSTVKISFSLLDFYSSTSLSRSWSTTQLATHGAAPKSIGSEVEKSVRSVLQNTVGRVSRSRDLFLFGLTNFFQPKGPAIKLEKPVAREKKKRKKERGRLGQTYNFSPFSVHFETSLENQHSLSLTSRKAT